MYKHKIKSVIEEINCRFNQQNTPKYNVPYKINDCIVFFWPCGGFILWDKFISRFSEDDGYWFTKDKECDYMSSSWIPDIITCLKSINDYLKENGEPYNYYDSERICGYKLK